MAETLPGFGVGSDDEDLPDLDEEVQSGLGRGLAAIIPTLADLDRPPPAGRRRRRRGGVAALLGTSAEAPAAPGEAAAPVPVDAAATTAAPPAPGADVGVSTVEVEPAPGADVGVSTVEVEPSAPPADATLAAAEPTVEADIEPVATAEPTVEAAIGPVAELLVEADIQPESMHIPAPSAVRKLRDDLVGALLDGLANTMALDLCAYLHQGPGEEPHLFLQSPALDGIGPARTYALFDALRVDLEAGHSDPDFAAAGFRGVVVATVGAGSRGLWAVARADDITTPEREVATRFCRSFGRAVHQLDGAAAPANTIARPLQVEVHRSRDSVLAEVQVRIGDQIRPGHGRAATRVEAITRAVLVAAGHSVTFRYASEVAHEGEHAAVVLLEGGDHAVALGSALSAESGGVATAQAALRALDGLTP